MKKHLLPLIAGLAASLPCAAAKPRASEPPANDLTVTATRHRVTCPLPGQAPCVINKPVSTNYRVLTPGLDLEDNGDRWVATFDKTRSGRMSIRVLGINGDLHDIEVSFSAARAAGAKAN